MLSVDDHINRKYAFKVSACFHSYQTLLACTFYGVAHLNAEKRGIRFLMMKKSMNENMKKMHLITGIKL